MCFATTATTQSNNVCFLLIVGEKNVRTSCFMISWSTEMTGIFGDVSNCATPSAVSGTFNFAEERSLLL